MADAESLATSTTLNAPSPELPGGIIAREERAATEAIRAALLEAGVDPGSRPVDLRSLPFEGTWGSASTVCRMVAGELVTKELEASGALEGLSKKDAKKLVNAQVGARAQELAEQVAANIRASGRFATVEAVNGYINLSYDANAMAASLVREVLTADATYGHAVPGSRDRRVMIEHSQLNTHKAAHVGHLRNICLGVAVTNISKAGGFTTLPATYIGDIGRHVVRCLWCYSRFHAGEEPDAGISRGRWLGEIYAESDARLSFRKDVVDFLARLVQEDEVFVAAVDRMLKFLWRQNVEGEDIAYLLGRISSQQAIDVNELRDPNVMVPFWPIIGDQLRAEAERPAPEPTGDAEAAAADSAPPSELLPEF
jgi:arginyl-tRNA synthetase